MVLTQDLDLTTIALGALIDDDDAVMRLADLAELLQTNLGGHGVWFLL